MKHANVSGLMPTESVPQSDRNGSTNDEARPSSKLQTNRLPNAGALNAARAATRTRPAKDCTKDSPFIVISSSALPGGHRQASANRGCQRRLDVAGQSV